MSKIKEENDIQLETLINIFTVTKGKLKILLKRRIEEPYKGYWELPGELLKKDQTLEENVNNIIKNTIKKENIYIEQDNTFSEINRNPNKRILATSYIALIDQKDIEETDQEKWFHVEEIPKLAFDHKEVIEKAKEKIKTKIVNINVLKHLFPNTFTLPEIQTVFESILNIKLDRRNFRKKFINLGLIEEVGYNNAGGSGRPAKLYKFKENLKEKNLF